MSGGCVLYSDRVSLCLLNDPPTSYLSNCICIGNSTTLNSESLFNSSSDNFGLSFVYNVFV